MPNASMWGRGEVPRPERWRRGLVGSSALPCFPDDAAVFGMVPVLPGAELDEDADELRVTVERHALEHRAAASVQPVTDRVTDSGELAHHCSRHDSSNQACATRAMPAARRHPIASSTSVIMRSSACRRR